MHSFGGFIFFNTSFCFDIYSVVTFEVKQIKNEHWKENIEEKQIILFKSM